MLQHEKFANALTFLAGHVTRMQEKFRGFVDRSLVQPQQPDRVGNSIGLERTRCASALASSASSSA